MTGAVQPCAPHPVPTWARHAQRGPKGRRACSASVEWSPLPSESVVPLGWRSNKYSPPKAEPLPARQAWKEGRVQGAFFAFLAPNSPNQSWPRQA